MSEVHLSDDEWLGSEGETDEVQERPAKRRSVIRGELLAKERRLSAEHAEQCRLPTDSNEVRTMLQTLKKAIAGQRVDEHMSRKIVHEALTLQLDYLETKQKNGKRKTKPPKVRETVCRHLAIGGGTYTSILRAFLLNHDAYASNSSGNFVSKEKRIAETKGAQMAIQIFV